MKNQFFYTIIEQGKDTEFKGSFNPEYVIRTMNVQPNQLVVMLDDFHEMKVPQRSMNRNGKITETTEKQTVCSEIWLNEVDSKRYQELFEIV